MKLYIALIHYPVLNKKGDIVSTCITGFDLHDIGRTCLTYGISKYFIVNPFPTQQAFAKRMIDTWKEEESLLHNWTKAEAFKIMEIRSNLEEVLKELGNIKIVATSARKAGSVKYSDLKEKMKTDKDDYLFLFGTGYGLADEIMQKANYVLEPIEGPTDYNHLPVRSAAAIIFDRLLGRE